MNILVYIDQMKFGGAARVTSVMCQVLVEQGHSVFLLQCSAEECFYPLPDKVVVIKQVQSKRYPCVIGGMGNFIWRLHSTRETIKKLKADVVISVLPYQFLVSKLSTLFLNIPIIACDHTSFSRKTNFLYNFIRFYFYKYTDVLTILTNRDYNLLGKKYPQKVVVYNPLPYPPINYEAKRKKTILCVGRIDDWKVKGFDMAIEVWSLIHSKHKDWVLQIAGGGSEKSIAYLKEHAANCGIKEGIEFLGQVKNIKDLYSQTSIFALTSRIEGMPMVLLEAMSQGCSCISFSIKGIVNEIIEDTTNGILVEDGNISAYASKLDLLIEDVEKRKLLAKKSVERSMDFSVSKFSKKWEEILSQYNK